MKYCYILNASGEEAPTVYTSLNKLMRDLGRHRQYQTFRRTFEKESIIKLGDLSIEKGILVPTTRS